MRIALGADLLLISCRRGTMYSHHRQQRSLSLLLINASRRRRGATQFRWASSINRPMDTPEVLRAKFEAELGPICVHSLRAKLLKYWRQIKEFAGNPRVVLKHSFWRSPQKQEPLGKQVEALLAQFNRQHQWSNFQIVSPLLPSYRRLFSVLFNWDLISLAVALVAIWWFRPRRGIRREHKRPMAQCPVDFEQFVADYLSTRQAWSLYYYPSRDSAVATVAEKTDSDHTKQIHVNLKDIQPETFESRLAEEQNRLGIDPEEHIHLKTHEKPTLLRHIIYWNVCLWALVPGALILEWATMRFLFRVVARRRRGPSSAKS